MRDPAGDATAWWSMGTASIPVLPLFLMPGIFAQTFADFGERMEDHLDLRRIDPSYRIHYLYFVGASTHPGTGLPTVLISAKLVTERILEDHGLA